MRGLFWFFCTLIYCWFHVSILMLSLIFMGWSITAWVTECSACRLCSAFHLEMGQKGFFFFSFTVSALLLLFSIHCTKTVCTFHTSAFNRTTLEPEHAATFQLSGHSDRCTTLPSNVPTTLPEAITPGTQMSWLWDKKKRQTENGYILERHHLYFWMFLTPDEQIC